MAGELRKGEELFLGKHREIHGGKEIKSKEGLSHFEVAKENFSNNRINKERD